MHPAIQMCFRGKTIAPYCDVVDYSNMSCSQERKSVNICNLVKYSHLLDSEYQVRLSKATSYIIYNNINTITK